MQSKVKNKDNRNWKVKIIVLLRMYQLTNKYYDIEFNNVKYNITDNL